MSLCEHSETVIIWERRRETLFCMAKKEYQRRTFILRSKDPAARISVSRSTVIGW